MSQDRKTLIRLAAKRPVGDPVRRVLLGELQKTGADSQGKYCIPYDGRSVELTGYMSTSDEKELAEKVGRVEKATQMFARKFGRKFGFEDTPRIKLRKSSQKNNYGSYLTTIDVSVDWGSRDWEATHRQVYTAEGLDPEKVDARSEANSHIMPERLRDIWGKYLKKMGFSIASRRC